MALAFRVHLDKENETPVAVFNDAKSFGPNKNLVQPTPRKALFDVKNDQQHASSRVNPGKGLNFPGSALKQSKPKLGSINTENHNEGHQKSKKLPQKKLTKKIKRPEVGSQPPAPKLKVNVPTQPFLVYKESKEDEYDSESESIFPRAMRLSTYADKLLAWRPPCLFGVAPDSESDISDTEDVPLPELELLDIIVPEPDDIIDFEIGPLVPVPLPDMEMPEQTADNPVRGDMSLLSSPGFTSPDMSLTLSPNTSLSLGSLRVMTGSLDTSLVETLSNDDEHTATTSH